ncbi:MAG: isopentenyl-diphosphate Delta-isomerase [bacterium]|nr:isopentenyl-diphosphate Delta-isomerase [bacterium]
MEVILVDKKDNIVGVGEKLKVHREGKLHRCFSIFIFNKKGEMLLQKRAKSKYHSGGLWSNACCSHPRSDKKTEDEARKRLKEEMGISCKLKEVFSFIYKANLGNLIEHEFDHVFRGKFDGNPSPDEKEADGWKWISLKDLKEDVKENPEKYTAWFKIILEKEYSKKIWSISRF